MIDSAASHVEEVVIAHVGPLLEPLLFAPAFLAVGYSLLRSRRRPAPPKKETPDDR